MGAPGAFFGGRSALSMAETGGSDKAPMGRREPTKETLSRLNLREGGSKDFVWEDKIVEPLIHVKWLAIAMVHATRGFSPTTLYFDMRSAWNLARDVVWRKIDENLFTVQFNCLRYWNRAMLMGPWLFRYQALIHEEYDGFKTHGL